MKIKFYGGQEEVGRSCIMIISEQSKILLDAGIKVGDEDPYPKLPDAELKNIDGIFISHAHLDHCGYLPHIYSAGYDRKVFATQATMEILNVMINDYMRLSEPENVSKEGLRRLMRNYVVAEYMKTIKLKDLTIKFIPAGHILGSSLISVSDGKHTVLYTGDINLASTRLMEGADTRTLKADTLITESTYAGRDDKFPPENTIVKGMVDSVKETLMQNGSVIIPSFAVGRAQEVLLILDDYMNSGKIPKVPIYIDGMINKITRIHRHNILSCRKELQMKILVSEYDPFKSNNYKPVEKKQSRMKVIRDGEPKIIVTTSGMLSGGPVLEYLTHMARNPLNKLLMVGYQAKGTLGNELQNGAKEVEIDKKKVAIKLKVETFHLSAHADRPQLLNLLTKVKGLKNVFIVHGEKSKSEQFREDISKKYKATVPSIGSTHTL
ncbi:MAG: MBL fold metallo-hydrolase [Candidatus Marsarchaeota archaeon]|nr:MBL fold metallo-hydrolase [Candidatus Marsarchaeota archaeon]